MTAKEWTFANRYVLLKLLLLYYLFLVIGSEDMERQLCTGSDCNNLYLAGLFPMSHSDKEVIGKGVLPAVELALSHINHDPTVLPHHTLKMVWNDTMCDMAVGTKIFFDMMHQDPPKVMLFGGACNHVTAPIAESSKWWNIWQLSYADTNPLLSDKATFPLFFRTVPSDTDHNPARMQLLRHFNWTRVGTLFQDASRGSSRYAHAHQMFLELLDDEGIERETASFSTDPEPALTILKQKDIRIIIGNFDEEMARKVFCSAIDQKMVGAKYVWVISGDYNTRWMRVRDKSISCSRDQLLQAIQGYIGTDLLPLSTSDERTAAGLTASQYNNLYNGVRGDYYSHFHGYAYDGVWVIARALDTIIQQNGGVYSPSDFRNERMHGVLNDTNFMGVTGRISFRSGDRVGELMFKQFQGRRMVKIGEYNAHYNEMDLTKGMPIDWIGNKPPRDRTLVERHLQRVNVTLYVIMCFIASLGAVVAIFFLVVNIRYRAHRYIKMSSPNMNNLIIAGCILAYISIVLLGLDGGLIPPQRFAYMCSIRAWVLSIGFTLSFGAMFSKTWRVHVIFTDIKLHKKAIKDSKLLLIVGVLLLVDVLLLSAWQIVDPLLRETRELEPEVDPSGDVEVIPVIEFCISRYTSIWLGVIYAYKGLLLIFGCFLAWETRSVNIQALNDSKYIGMSVYNVVIMCVSGVPISFIIKDKLDAAYLIIGLFIIFCTTITLCLVFMPKLIELRRDPHGEEKRVRAALHNRGSLRRDTNPTCTAIQAEIKALAQENYEFKQVLSQKNKEIRCLLLQLGEDLPFGESIPASPAHRSIVALRSDCNRLSPSRLSFGNLSSEDTASIFSVSSGTNNWPVDGLGARMYLQGRQDSVDTSVTETIELADIGCRQPSKLPPLKDSSPLDQVTPRPEADEKHYGDVSFEDDLRKEASDHRYNELNYVDDLCNTRETDILSDESVDEDTQADVSGFISEHDDEADTTTSLLS